VALAITSNPLHAQAVRIAQDDVAEGELDAAKRTERVLLPVTNHCYTWPNRGAIKRR